MGSGAPPTTLPQAPRAAARAPEHAAPTRQVEAKAQPSSAAPAKAPEAAAAQRFDRMAVRAKLAVSQPGDAVEQEADAVAARVMRMPATHTDRPGPAPHTGTPPIRRQPHGATLPGAGRPPQADPDILNRLGAGEPLDLDTRAFFEPRLGMDLGGVRVHADGPADSAARDLQARAFTLGDHIAFAAGEYAPQTPAGRELLAHELAHVAQLAQGAARQVMRTDDDDDSAAVDATGVGTATPAAAATATAAAAAPSAEPPITLPSLKLPGFKALVPHRQALYQAKKDAGTLARPSGYERGDTRQSATWMREAQPAGATTVLQARLGAGLAQDKALIALPSRARTRGLMVGTPAELAENARRPLWNRDGSFQTFHVDHIVELQVGGEDAIGNMELLAAGPNQASGRDIRQHIETELAAWKTTNPDETRSVAEIKAARRIVFSDFNGTLAPAEADHWTLEQINTGAHFSTETGAVDLLDPQAPARGAPYAPWPRHLDPASFTGSATQVVLYPRASGGMACSVSWPVEGGEERPVPTGSALGSWIAGLSVQHMRFTPGSGTGEAGWLRGRLFSGNPRLAFDGVPVQIPIDRKAALPYAGSINRTTVQRQIASIFSERGVSGASPVQVRAFDLDPASGALLRGTLQPSIAMLRGASIDLVIEGDDLRAEKTFTGAELRLGGPIHVTGSDLTLSIGTASGVRAIGGADFAIDRLGQGRVEGRAGSRDGFSLAGAFDFDRTLFDADASIRLRYERSPDAPDGKLSGSGTVSIGPGKVRGIRRATVNAAFDGEQRSLQGSAELDIPGVESATLGVQFTPEGGTLITGSARFRDTPGIRNGQISATLSQGEGGWRLAASGSAQAAFAGITTTLAASYDDGLFMFAADAPFAVGDRVSGNVRVGVTNGQVDDAGRLLPGSGPAAGEASTLRPFGNGNVNVRITDWLQGGVGLRVRPTGELLVSGRIGIPAPVTVFGQVPSPERARRTLFEMPMVSVPLVGLSVGSTVVGVALTINGRVTGHASIGPGRLTQTEIAVEDFNPARPETLHVTGGATFDLPAQAGIAATLDAGVTLGAAIVRATAGVSVSAEAGLQAHVTPHVDIDWRAASGLHLHAEIDASLAPRLAFDVNGYAEVVANALVTSFTLWRKEWNLAHREVGSSLALRMNVPVDYYSDGRGVVFDPAAVRLDVPPLDGSLLDRLLNDEGGTESVQRPETAH